MVVEKFKILNCVDNLSSINNEYQAEQIKILGIST